MINPTNDNVVIQPSNVDGVTAGGIITTVVDLDKGQGLGIILAVGPDCTKSEVGEEVHYWINFGFPAILDKKRCDVVHENAIFGKTPVSVSAPGTTLPKCSIADCYETTTNNASYCQKHLL